MTGTEIKKYLQDWEARYRADLVENIMPFWLEHGLDPVNGGVYTCLDRDGTLMDSTKSVWFQGRYAFVCAFAYNNVEKDPAYLAAAKSCLDFIEEHCFAPDGHMYFEVTAEGKGLRRRRYVFSECFAIIAMAEYSLATGDKSYGLKALELFKRVRRFLSTPGFLEPKYEPDVRMEGHSITMILINTAAKVREVVSDPCLDEQIEASVGKIRDLFMHPEYKALLEVVTPEGGLVDTLAGRTINPGHCIETAWFLLEESRHRGWDPAIKDMALTIFDWSWDWGWDEEYGGIINFRDCKGFPNQDYSQDMKFWWPQTEGVICTLYAYLATRDEKYLALHRQVSEYLYAHFPDPDYPEWYGYLHRDGTPAHRAKGNLFKGPFHIPRMLVKGGVLCREILATL